MSNVEAAIQRELEQMPDDLRESGIAAVALAMAEAMDSGKGSRSECGKVALEALGKLHDLKPPERKKTVVDELSARRVGQRAGSATA